MVRIASYKRAARIIIVIPGQVKLVLQVTKVPAMQRQTKQNLETRYLLFVATLILGAGGVPAARNSNGRWQLVRGCPVMLGLTQSQSRGNTTMTVVPLVKQIQQQPGNPSEPAAPPLQPAESGTEVEVDVDDMHSVFGVLRAKENDVNDEIIDIVVDPPPDMNPDLSCKALLLLALAWRRPTPA